MSNESTNEPTQEDLLTVWELAKIAAIAAKKCYNGEATSLDVTMAQASLANYVGSIIEGNSKSTFPKVKSDEREIPMRRTLGPVPGHIILAIAWIAVVTSAVQTYSDWRAYSAIGFLSLAGVLGLSMWLWPKKAK